MSNPSPVVTSKFRDGAYIILMSDASERSFIVDGSVAANYRGLFVQRGGQLTLQRQLALESLPVAIKVVMS